MAAVVAVVTGGNKGIGFAIVRALCKEFSGDVILTARDEGRGLAAVKKLKDEGLQAIFHQLDIQDEASISRLAAYIKDLYGSLSVLVNNAAIAYKMADTTPFAKQAEDTITVNFFGTLMVCSYLFPLLSPHARVVNLSSSAGVLSQYISSEDLQNQFKSETLTEEGLCNLMLKFISDAKAGVHEKNGWGSRAYSISKIAVNALTCIQQREFLKDSRQDLIVNAVHPGYVDTDMSSHQGPLTPDQGAEAPVFCALLHHYATSPKGEFIWNDKSIRSWH